MDFKTGMLAIVVGMVVIGVVSEVYAYTYETVAEGPHQDTSCHNIGAYDLTYGGVYDWSTSQWNYQGGGEWWGYSDSSRNGYNPNSYSGDPNQAGVCARAYNSYLHRPYNKVCSNSGGYYAYAFSGWSSNMQSQQRDVYCG